MPGSRGLLRCSVSGGLDRHTGGCGALDHHDVFREGSSLSDERAVGSDAERGAIEDEAVVAADLVADEDRQMMAFGDGREHALAGEDLAVPEGRRGDIEQQRRLLLHQVFDGVDGVETLRPEVLIVPGVLADRYGEAFSFEVDDLLAGGWGEIALLIEYVVKGQQHLMLLEENLALVHEDCRIYGGFAGVWRRGQSHADEDGGGQVGRSLTQFLKDRLAAGEEARLFNEVGGPVAAEGELGEDGETGAGARGSLAGAHDFSDIAGEVSDGGVDLSQCDLHFFSLQGTVNSDQMSENSGQRTVRTTKAKRCGDQTCLRTQISSKTAVALSHF